MNNKNDYESLKNKYNTFMSVEERNKKGHIIIDLTQFNNPQYRNKEPEFIQYNMFVILQALEICKKYNNENKIIVHVNMVGTTRDNFSLTFFKRVNKFLDQAFPEEIMETCYVYSKSKLTTILWKLIKPILQPESRNKFKIVKIK